MITTELPLGQGGGCPMLIHVNVSTCTKSSVIIHDGVDAYASNHIFEVHPFKV